MKFQRIVMIAGFSTWTWIASATPEPATPPLPEKSLETLIQELSDAKFRTREEASRKIWAIGDTALPALEVVEAGKDPEQAYRARELIRKIQLFITPETDPVVIDLVERYANASEHEKEDIFEKLLRKRAWRQLLKLYSTETNAELREKLELPLRSNRDGDFGIASVAVIAARECLVKGDSNGAREFLEMAPATAVGLLALADFHRNQGTLPAELKRALTLKGAQADAWQLALYRASGNIAAAKDAAAAADEPKISALMSTMSGDPLPWLQLDRGDSHTEQKTATYTDLAIRRWQGKPIRELDQYPLMLAVNSRNVADQTSAMTSLFLLGETAAAEIPLAKVSKQSAYGYYESMDRIPEALKMLGLDPEKADYTAWVAERFEKISKEEKEDYGPTPATKDLLLLATFLESRGLFQQQEEAYLKPLLALAEKDEDVFLNFFRQLCAITNTTDPLEKSRQGGVPVLLKKVIGQWAGEKEERWDDALASLFGEQEEVRDLWDWLAEMNPAANRADRLSGMVALAGIGRDSEKLRAKWMDLAWTEVEKTPVERRQAVLVKMTFLVGQCADAKNQLKLWDMLPADKREEMMGGVFLDNYTAVGRWDEAAEWILKQIAARVAAKAEPVPMLHAYAAAFLRRAGRVGEAAEHDAWVDRLALGHDADKISGAYSYGDDYERAAIWAERAVRECDPENLEKLKSVLNFHRAALMEQGKWREMAAHAEVLAQLLATTSRTAGSSTLAMLNVRFQSDLGRALGNLNTDRAGSLALINQALKNFPSDGNLADDFFPSVRKAGLLKEHDEWFKASWERMSAVISRFPDCDNTCNTTAWLASRARLKLDEAEKLESKVIFQNPEESSYLDTMAEIQFALGDRKKAVEYSARAVNFQPGGEQAPILRRQYERFRTEPLPR